MTPEEGLQAVRAALDVGIALLKYQQCGCMESTLQHLAAALPTLSTEAALPLAEGVVEWRKKMRPVQYACLGCAYYYPPVAQNTLAHAFPSLSHTADVDCEFRLGDAGWPPVVGEYFVLDPAGSVAVSTLASVSLAEALAHRHPPGLALVGKTETENIGIDKLIKNVVASPTLRYMIVAGTDPEGHRPGTTLLALAEHGVDANGRVIGSPGKRPILRNVSVAEIQAFRKQMRVIDMVGCEHLDEMSAQIAALSHQSPPPDGERERGASSSISLGFLASTVPRIIAIEPRDAVRMDKAGYFVIVPLANRGVINVEQYAYDHTQLRVIEGPTARALYTTVIQAGWVTELSHAAYLGKELIRAEYALRHGLQYVQDGA